MGDSRVPESRADVLIIGAGPAGLAAAYWMAKYGVNARIIDKRGTKVFTGQADSLRARTQELFDSMGILHRVEKEAQVVNEFRVWSPNGNGGIQRVSAIRRTKESYAKSRFFSSGLSQGRVERFLLDAIKEANPNLHIERGVIAESLEYNEELENDHQAYPATVTVRTLSDEEASPSSVYGSSSAEVRNGLFRSNLSPDDWEELINASKAKSGRVEVIKARYVIGADGAHSWTRKQMGAKMEGEASDFVWGVMDVVPISNFPDIRQSCMIKSSVGSTLTFGREDNLMRLYIPLSEVAHGLGLGQIDRSNIDLGTMKTIAKAIFKPYDFDFRVCEWWSAYQVGRRVASKLTRGNRIFIAGDAAHTHTPKAGVGMNISIQDGFNLGWKVASAAAGITKPEAILPTYELERHPIAKTLFEFDQTWSDLFTNDKISPGEFKARDERYSDFAQGLLLEYPNSSLVDRRWKVDIAAKLVAGERFWPAKLTAHADGLPAWSTNIMKSDGRWRIVVLAGDVSVPAQRARLQSLCTHLGQEDGDSIRRRFTPSERKINSVIDVIAIHSAPRTSLDLYDFPEVLRPMDDKGIDYYKIWVDEDQEFDQDADGMAFDKWGLDRKRGAVAIMRPDQYIGWLGDLEDVPEMRNYLDGVLCTAE